MNRTHPAEVRRQLRQEVGFGCPVLGCRQAMLTWHHFDPPWRDEEHHRPEGMIALCQKHHAAAELGVFSREELRDLKRAASTNDPATAQIPWFKKEFLVRLGGMYSGGSHAVLNLGGSPIIRLVKDITGHLLLNAALVCPNGEVPVVVNDNCFECDPSLIHDLETNTGATSIKIWFARRNIGLDLSVSRLTINELETVITKDYDRSNTRILKNPTYVVEDFGPPSGDFIAYRTNLFKKNGITSRGCDS